MFYSFISSGLQFPSHTNFVRLLRWSAVLLNNTIAGQYSVLPPIAFRPKLQPLPKSLQVVYGVADAWVLTAP